tara:strand:- start:917 stop:1315 length:399 start_codon:yes stop_codon:yes gene_type:complete
MQIVNISGLYNVSPQISSTDIEILSEKGFEKIICNRPDFEVHPNIQSNLIKKVATEMGISFEYHPLTFENMNAENIGKQMDFINESERPVLAYCTSGTRCAAIWALGQIGKMSKDKILKTTLESGYNLEGLL